MVYRVEGGGKGGEKVQGEGGRGRGRLRPIRFRPILSGLSDHPQC